jgi:two-component system cell cycle sensor histidine kinase/response regulator CckA
MLSARTFLAYLSAVPEAMRHFYRFSSVRMKLVGTVLLLTVPALLLMYIYEVPLTGFIVGFLSLVAAWMGGELFVRRQVQAMSQTAQKIADGDLSARTGLPDSHDEIGQLAKIFDRMAESLELRIKEREKLAAFAQLNPYCAMEFSADGEMTYYNDAALKLSYSVEKTHPREVLPENAQKIVRDCLVTNRSRTNLLTMIGDRTFSWSFHPMMGSFVVHCYAEDITNRLSLEAQLRQSQKMESVGLLAAGVAHDFNNMLTIIQGHSSILLARTDLSSDVVDPLQAVYFAAERAANLTRQLLMFSRKNVMQPRPLDLRDIIGHLGKMVQRLIGENIAFEFLAPEKLPAVRGDHGMIEQVVMNLVVNARDAMPSGGKLIVRLDTLDIDPIYVEMHPDAREGLFVRLRCKDTGTGMDTATMNRIFEPFFTTKDVGKGTGLGLATVYGIVKQHHGWIEVNSEPGKGTTFDIFFPVEKSEDPAEQQKTSTDGAVLGGNETILIVEDEPVLREMGRAILEQYGYRILEAGNGKEALEVWRQSANDIHLLLTDMVMPEGMSGVTLAEHLLRDRPDLKIVFTSGYSTHEINDELLARSQSFFLQKPYSHVTLGRTIRECLDRNCVVSA